MSRIRVYPDTNIALHCKPFEEIDWCALTSASQVEIVLCANFLRELDNIKNRERGAVQDRARRIVSRLGKREAESDWDLRVGVTLSVEISEPTNFDQHGLDRTVNDDRLIAAILQDDAGMPIACLTDDILLVMKAKARAIRVIRPSETDRLPMPVKDQRASAPAARSPALLVRFADNVDHTVAAVSVVRPLTAEFIDGYIARESDRLRLDRTAVMHSIYSDIPSEDEVRNYLIQLRAWMDSYAANASANGLAFRLDVQLTNAGDGGAENIDVDLTFPEDVFLSPTPHRDPVTAPPTRPTPKIPWSKYHEARLPQPASLDRLFRQVNAIVPETVTLKGAHQCHWHVDALKHTTEVRLPPFGVRVAAGVPGFPIRCRIHSATKLVEHDLNVRLESQEVVIGFADLDRVLNDKE